MPQHCYCDFLVLQLSLRTGFALMPLPVTVLGHGLMDAPPQRPAKEMIEHYAGGTLQAANELADLAHAEGDQSSRLRSPLLCDVTALSFTRRAARKPKASMARACSTLNFRTGIAFCPS